MDEIMERSKQRPVQMSAYLTALAMKGETIDEITASAAGMRCTLHQAASRYGRVGNRGNRRRRIQFLQHFHNGFAGHRSRRGAGGENTETELLLLNPVQPTCWKHWESTSTIAPERSAEILKKSNICFLFAQNYHVAMKYVAPIRKELGIRTVVQHSGTAEQSGRCQHGTDGCLR